MDKPDHDFEARLRGLRIAGPRADLRRRILSADTATPTPAAWSWAPEIALAAGVLLCALGLVALHGPGAAVLGSALGTDVVGSSSRPSLAAGLAALPDLEAMRRQVEASARLVASSLELGAPLTHHLGTQMAVSRLALEAETARRMLEPPRLPQEQP